MAGKTRQIGLADAGNGSLRPMVVRTYTSTREEDNKIIFFTAAHAIEQG